MDQGFLTPGRARRLSVACIATCPPRQCGIATFSSDLAEAMRGVDPELDLSFAAVERSGADGYAPEVKWHIAQGDPASYRRLAQDLNATDVDVVLIQHEFGLFGIWGPTFDDHLADFMALIDAPVVAILHSVPPDPSASVRAAVRLLGHRSAQLIVMADFAKGLLADRYGLNPTSISVIPHGVPSPPVVERARIRRRLGVAGRQLITTFGFLDPHKGLEHMITAMSSVVERFPKAQYVIVGRTHPELAQRDGEAYRHQLEADVAERGLSANIGFVDEYVSLDQIVEYLAASDVYVTPYLDMNQVTSGTLAYALGQGRAVVSTPYIHAVEALAQGRGIIVPPAESPPLADAVIELLARPGYRRAMEARASVYGNSMAWPVVAAQTLRILHRAARQAQARPRRGPVPVFAEGAGQSLVRTTDIYRDVATATG
jgi:glycosyltransferase involved in cell wall biosynthesis